MEPVGTLPNMSAVEIVVITGAILLAATVYMIVGFGFSLLSMPLLVLVVPVPDALVIMALLGILSTAWQGIALRADRVRPLVRRLVVATYAGMPVGLVILNVLDDRILRAAVGVGVLAATGALASGVQLRGVGPVVDYSLGLLSGVLSTSIGVNGPPLVFDVQGRSLSPDQVRATIAAVFAMGSPLGIVLFVLDDKVTSDGLRATMIAFPAWALGSLAGRAIRPRIAPERFRWVVLGLLGFSGTVALVTALAE